MANNLNNKSPKRESMSKNPGSDEEKKELMNEYENVTHGNTQPAIAVNSMTPGSTTMSEVMEMLVFLRDRSAIHFSLEEGHQAMAEEILDMAMEEQNLPPLARQVFALWVVSDLLDLRMKKCHIPYRVLQEWDVLCAKHTDAKFEDIVKTEPVLMIQRDVFFSLDQEREINNEQILCLLYHEAKFNVIEGRYLLFPEDYHRLAGIQALIHLGKYNPREHTPANYRSSLIQFYPEHMYQTQKFLFFTTSRGDEFEMCESMLMREHQQLSDEFANKNVSDILPLLYNRYLDICRNYPMYGSAFFFGQIERPVGRFKKFMNIGNDIKCLIAINTECVTVLDKEKDEITLSIPFTQLSWEYKEAQFDVDDDSLPCLYLQFMYDCPQNGQVTKLLEIYSREAKFMDALITTCVKRKIDSGVKPEESVANFDNVDSAEVLYTDKKTIHKLDKLCVATYTVKGERLD